MKYIHMCFVAHHTQQLKTNYSFFDIGRDQNYFNENENLENLHYLCNNCYLPTNKVLLQMIKEHKGVFKFSFDISSILIQQLKQHRPDVLNSFQELVSTGAVEILCGNGYHSLSSLLSDSEFKKQVKEHKQQIKQEFNQVPKIFINTDLIYDNHISNLISEMNFLGIIAEGAKRVLGWRSPNFVYQPQHHHKIKLLFRNFELSDIIAFRFSDTTWENYPYSAGNFAASVAHILSDENVVNLVLDYETFGFYQRRESGILSFLKQIPQKIAKNKKMQFETASGILKKEQPIAKIDVDYPVSWSGNAKDVSTWMGNNLQHSSLEFLYKLEKKVQQKKDEETTKVWRELQDSDYLSYMDTRWQNPNFVPHTKNPFQSPEQAYIVYNNILNDFANKLA